MNIKAKDQHKQRGFKMLVVFGKRTSKNGHKSVFFIVG